MKLFGHSAVPPLWAGLFDDAALFPPASLPMINAVAEHGRHRHAWYSDAVGYFVCRFDALHELDAAAQHARFSEANVAVTVPDGIAAAKQARESAAEYGWIHVKSLEVPVAADEAVAAALVLAPLTGHGCVGYLEVPVAAVTMELASALKTTGIGLKLRCGATGTTPVPTADALTAALHAVIGSGVLFKVTAGLHHAVRGVDSDTGQTHHGFANLLCAVDVLQTRGDDFTARTWLESSDVVAVAAHLHALSPHRVQALRGQLRSIGTCSISEPVEDLVALGLLKRS